MRAALFLAGMAAVAVFASALSPTQAAGPPFIHQEAHHADKTAFLTKIERAIEMESLSSEAALLRTKNDAVRSLAKRLADHARILSAGLKALGAEGVSIPSAKPSGADRETLESLKHIPVSNIDTRYLEAMRALYEETLQDLKAYRENGPNGPAKDFASQIIPRAERNLSAIRQLQDHI